MKPFFRLHQLDWLVFLQSIPDQSIDLILTDPPYRSIDRHRYGTHQRLKSWFPTIDNSVYWEMLQQFDRVLRNNRHFYIFTDEETNTIIKNDGIFVDSTGDMWMCHRGDQARVRFWKSIVWDKQARGMGYHYATSHELIMFFEKGKRPLNDLSHQSILRVPSIRDYSWPTEKPVQLAELLIRNSTMQGMTVLDPFMGSGAFGEAALKSGCNFIGNDLLPESVSLVESRLSKPSL